MQLRTRLTIVAGCATLLAFGAASFLVSTTFTRAATSQLEATANKQLDALDDELKGDGKLDDLPLRTGGRELLAQVTDSAGVVRSTSAPLQDLGALPPPRGTSSGYDVTVGGTRLFVRERAAPEGSRVQIAIDREQVDEGTRRLNISLVLGLIGGVLIATILARLMVGRALQPLDRIIATAHHVGRTGELEHAVPEQDRPDELGRLATVFNGMIGRLRLAQDGQRRFVADASHELKTPITSLSGNLEFLGRSGVDEATRAEVMADLRADVTRLQGLATDLVALARADAGGSTRLEQVDLRPYLERTVARMARSAPDHRLEIHGSEASLQADPEALDRIVGNLVGNAMKYTPAGTTIRLDLTSSDDEVILTIADDGPGMDPADAARAFDRFHRGGTAQGTTGSGLGLAIVSQAVRAHGGTIQLDADRGRGCKFTIRLPAA